MFAVLVWGIGCRSVGSESGGGAALCEPGDLEVELGFGTGGKANLAAVTARVPEGMEPDRAELTYTVDPFSFSGAIDVEKFVEDGAFAWLHPFPAGSEVALELQLCEGSCCAAGELDFETPKLSYLDFPEFTSDWSYEVYPRPMIATSSVSVLDGDTYTDYILILDQQGRYIWSHPLVGPRAFPEENGVLMLPGIEERSDLAPIPLQRIRWDGEADATELRVQDFHHDFAVSADHEAIHLLSYEHLDELAESCGRPDALGDVIQAASIDDIEDLWRTSEDFPPEYYGCRDISDKSVSYLNGIAFHDEVVAASSSPLSEGRPPGFIVGFMEEGSWRTIYTSEIDSETGASLEALPECVAEGASPGVLLKPHSAICEATMVDGRRRELNCFIHNRRIIELCDTVDWVQLEIDGDDSSALCLASTLPDHPPASADCGSGAHHGNFAILDGRLDDPEGLFGVHFSPVGGYIAGVRASREGGARIEEVFRIYDPNADRSEQDPEDGASCLDGGRPCLANGRFLTATTGLMERWSPSGG